MFSATFDTTDHVQEYMTKRVYYRHKRKDDMDGIDPLTLMLNGNIIDMGEKLFDNLDN